MPADSIEAYDAPERVHKYDADMDIMHPLRHKMIEIALDVLPFDVLDNLKVLDLGVGTGAFAFCILERYPNSTVVAVDGSSSMLELAKARLHEYGQRVHYVVADFRSIPPANLAPDTFDVVISSYALHHLDAQEKLAALRSIVPAIKPGGWVLNADIVVANYPVVERRIQEIRVEAVSERAPADDERFADPATTRAHLDQLEANEQDQPLTLAEDLRILREAGIENAEVFWKELRETVVGGWKPGAG
jgi:ubiquinone/menaquinone biosynthesis C-methylase UbiE